MKIKETFENQERNKKTYSNLEKYWKYIISFETSEKSNGKEENNADGVHELGYIGKGGTYSLPNDIVSDICKERVWALFGWNGEEWSCLQVAQTKYKIIQEIDSVINLIINREENDGDKFADTTFYRNVYPRSADKRKSSYGKMGMDYSEFRICILDVDAYLDIVDGEMSEDMKNIISIAKYCYAEAKLAYETLAPFWNMYNSGIDGQSIMCFLEKEQKEYPVIDR